MNTRHLVWLGAIIGGFIGGWIPSLWDAGFLSFSGIILSLAGASAGIFIGEKIASW